MDRAAAARAYLPAARQAIAAFPVRPADLTPVWISENVTFRVTDARDGAAYALRLHRPGYHDLPALTSERVWTRALAAAGIGVPAGVRTLAGDDFAPVHIPHAGETRFAGLTAWTEGEVLADRLEREGLGDAPGRFRRLGAVIAALHTQAAGWTPPGGFTRHALDTAGLMGEAPWWGRFWESPALSAAEQTALGCARDRLAAALDRLGRDPAIFSLIHADLHPGNVLAADERLTVIDFDDAAFGWLPYDLAVAVFHYRDRPEFPAIRAALLEGYRAARPLPADVEALIPMFLLIRGLAVIGWLGQRPEIDPGAYMAELKAWVLAQAAAFEPPV